MTRSGTSAAELEQDVQRRPGLGGNPERGPAAGVSRLQRRPDVKRGEVHGSVQRDPHHDVVGAHDPGHDAVPVQHQQVVDDRNKVATVPSAASLWYVGDTPRTPLGTARARTGCRSRARALRTQGSDIGQALVLLVPPSLNSHTAVAPTW
jgi:hypothetical protein